MGTVPLVLSPPVLPYPRNNTNNNIWTDEAAGNTTYAIHSLKPEALLWKSTAAEFGMMTTLSVSVQQSFCK